MPTGWLSREMAWKANHLGKAVSWNFVSFPAPEFTASILNSKVMASVGGTSGKVIRSEGWSPPRWDKGMKRVPENGAVLLSHVAVARRLICGPERIPSPHTKMLLPLDLGFFQPL